METRSIFYGSDFLVRLTNETGWDNPFIIRFWTTRPLSALVVGYDGETYEGCSVDSETGALLVPFDKFVKSHKQGLGTLMMELTLRVPDLLYPDQWEDKVMKPQPVICKNEDEEEFYIALGPKGDEDIVVGASVIAAWKGQKGDTPEIGENGNWWISGVDTEVKADYSSEEALRQSQESARAAAETARANAEATRQSAETTRNNAEATRQTNETERQGAEAQRAQTFTTNEAARQTAFSTAETQRQQTFTQNESGRNTSVQAAAASAQDAAASAANAAEDAAEAAQKLATIQSAIDDLDPSQSTDDAVVALAARQGVLEGDIAALGQETDKIRQSAFDLFHIKGKYINLSGVITATQNDNAITDYLEIPEDVVSITINGRSSNFVALCAFYDEEKNYINNSVIYGTDKSGIDYTIDASNIPDGAKYIIANGFGLGSDKLEGIINFRTVINNLSKAKNESQEYTNGIVKPIEDIVFAYVPVEDELGDISDYKIDVNGDIVAYSGHILKKYDIEDVKKLRITTYSTSNMNCLGWAIYCSSQTFDASTCIAKSGRVAEGTFTDEIRVAAGALTLIVEWSYSNVRMNLATLHASDAIEPIKKDLNDLKFVTRYYDANIAKYYNPNTQQFYNSTTIKSVMINVSAGNVVMSNTNLVSYSIGCVLLGENDTLVKSLTISQINDGYEITQQDITNGAKTIFVSYRASGDSAQTGVYFRLDSSRLEQEQKEAESHRIRVLYVGNSFARDSVCYVPALIKSLAENIRFSIGMAFIGSSSLGDWLACLSNSDVQFAGQTCSPQPCSYHRFTNDDSQWIQQSETDIRNIIANERWDIIVFQQVSTYAHSSWATYFEPYIYDIHKYASQYAGRGIKFGWTMTHVNDLDVELTKTSGIITNAQKMLSDTATEVIFPYGIAVQNLRTTPLKNLGVDGLLSPDGHHLNEGVGCLAAALSHTIVILKNAGYDKGSILGNTVIPTRAWCESINVVQPHPSDYSVILGADANSCYCAQAAAIASVKFPFEVKDCNDYYIS